MDDSRGPEPHLLRIEPGGFDVPMGPCQTVIEAALAAGIDLPRSCRNGTCRTCMCHLRVGHIRYRIEWPGLSADEKSEGWILPCVAMPLSDLVIESPQARLKQPT